MKIYNVRIVKIPVKILEDILPYIHTYPKNKGKYWISRFFTYEDDAEILPEFDKFIENQNILAHYLTYGWPMVQASVRSSGIKKSCKKIEKIYVFKTHINFFKLFFTEIFNQLFDKSYIMTLDKNPKEIHQDISKLVYWCQKNNIKNLYFDRLEVKLTNKNISELIKK